MQQQNHLAHIRLGKAQGTSLWDQKTLLFTILQDTSFTIPGPFTFLSLHLPSSSFLLFYPPVASVALFGIPSLPIPLQDFRLI